MASFADNLARLRVAAATGSVPQDLSRWAVEVIGNLAPVAERVATRDFLLREAAARLGGSRWAKARRLEREIRDLTSPSFRGRTDDPDGVRGLVAEALAVDPSAPRSVRQLLRILE